MKAFGFPPCELQRSGFGDAVGQSGRPRHLSQAVDPARAQFVLPGDALLEGLMGHAQRLGDQPFDFAGEFGRQLCFGHAAEVLEELFAEFAAEIAAVGGKLIVAHPDQPAVAVAQNRVRDQRGQESVGAVDRGPFGFVQRIGEKGEFFLPGAFVAGRFPGFADDVEIGVKQLPGVAEDPFGFIEIAPGQSIVGNIEGFDFGRGDTFGQQQSHAGRFQPARNQAQCPVGALEHRAGAVGGHGDFGSGDSHRSAPFPFMTGDDFPLIAGSGRLDRASVRPLQCGGLHGRSQLDDVQTDGGEVHHMGEFLN
ncbi:hypothetical protein SDC9_91472 [bioreactor metagenome]|uniref:Uncharacterized protein n=1 Tax=bioreactor metagenome TaxID=1076179 RepID=A0A644ZUZ1_9ZZZZ